MCTKIKILVIDDATCMRSIIKKFLTNMKFNDFLEAEDGACAFKVLEENVGAIDLIISDVNMPNVTGLDFIKNIKADSRFCNIPFIFVTAECEKKFAEASKKSGANYYLTKPFNNCQLQIAIYRAIENFSKKAS